MREIREKACDVLVVGGGLPGVCAAIAAARMGCQVILVERGTTLGGNCGPEVGVCPSDGHRFHPFMASSGIVGRLIEEAAHQNAKTVSNWHLYNISMQWDTIMAKALRDAGVETLRRHFAHTPEMDGDRIQAVLCEDTATYHPVRIRVRHFMIDASGDGNVSAEAGALWRMGRESRDEYGERSGQDVADTVTMGTSLVCLIRKTPSEVRFIPPEGTPPFHPSYRGMTPFAPKEGEECVFFYPCETGGEKDTIEDDHEIYDRLILQLYSAWNRVKNVTHVQEAQNWELTWVSARTAKRESRRFVGDYTLTQTDLEEGRVFPDSIATGGFAMDIHDPRPESPEYIQITYYSVPPTYGIPYRCTYSQNIANLFFASRLLSVSHMAHGSLRVQRTLATVGEAVGAAAALCVRHRFTPRELTGHIQCLQDVLSANDATVPLPTHPAPGDIAPLATVSADHEMRYGVAPGARWQALCQPMGVELWDFCEQIDDIAFLLKNEGRLPAKLKARVFRYHPPRRWAEHNERQNFADMKPAMEIEWGAIHRLDYFEELTAAEAEIAPGTQEYVSFPIHLHIAPKDALNDDDRIIVLLDPHPDVCLNQSDAAAEFARGIDQVNGNEYNAVPAVCAYRIHPQPAYGEARQAVTGQNRRFATVPVNMWRTDCLPATLSLSWDQPYVISRVQITFDTFTRHDHDMPFERQILQASPQCPVEYTLSVLRGSETVWQEKVTDNYHRFCSHDVPLAQGDRVSVMLQKTMLPGQTAGIYRIAVFAPYLREQRKI